MRRRASITIAALLMLGCTTLVGGGAPEGRPCRRGADGSDPCQAAFGVMFECSSVDPEVTGECVSACGPEVCDNADNDCDGVVDEGVPLDVDGDGFTGCPTSPGPIDCNDEDPAVHPARDGVAPPEICDGIDNDCDSATPDGASECDLETQFCAPLSEPRCRQIHCGIDSSRCAANEFCNASLDPPECAPSDTSCFAIACSDPEPRCNPETGTCVAGDRLHGQSCEYDAECASRLCAPLEAARLTTSIVVGGRGVCAQTCCTDADCAAGEVCWASGTGAQLCLPTAVLSMGAYGAPASGPCATDQDCPGAECNARLDDAYTVAGRVSRACAASTEPSTSCTGCSSAWCDSCWYTGDPNSFCVSGTCGLKACTSGAECESGICYGGACREPCGRTEDCGTTARLRPPRCTFREVTVGTGTGVVSFCYYDAAGAGRTGTPCADSIECRDQACVNAQGRESGSARQCADTCCGDAHCGDGQCRPIFIGGVWQMHCLPRPTFGPTGTRPS